MTDETAMSQSAIQEAAHEHGADENEARREERLRKLGKVKPEKPE